MRELSAEQITEIVHDLSKAKGRKRAAIVQEYAQRYGLSRGTIYRYAKKAGWNSGRKKRQDSGLHKIENFNEYCETVVSLIKKSTHKYKPQGGQFTTGDAIDLLERQKLIPPGVLKESTVNEWMRRNGLSRKEMNAPTPHLILRTDHPNHVHQVDTTRCAQWYLKDGGNEIGFQSGIDEVYKNKPTDKTTLFRYVLTDHFSGTFFFQYYPDEKASSHIDFLYRAWARKEDPSKFPFCGVPKILYTDKGSGLNNAAAKNLFRALDIDWITHRKGNSRAKGSVEGAQWLIERKFETALQVRPATTLFELNLWAFLKALELNNFIKHNRHGMSRFQAWNTIESEFLRLPPPEEIYKLLARQPKRCHVSSDGIVRFKGNQYSLWETDLEGKWVIALISPYSYPDIRFKSENSEDKREFLRSPIDWIKGVNLPANTRKFTEHIRAPRKTEQQKKLDSLEEKQLEINMDLVHTSCADKVRNVHHIPKSGSTIRVSNLPDYTLITPYQATVAVREYLGLERLTVEQNQWLQVRIKGQNVRDDAIPALAEELLKFMNRSKAIELRKTG